MTSHTDHQYKTKKYDRQLRLWKAHGQESLETSHVLAIGATAIVSETLKNLVLPGRCYVDMKI